MQDSFAKDVAKSFVISLTTTAGMFAGMIVIGYAISKFQDFRTKKS